MGRLQTTASAMGYVHLCYTRILTEHGFNLKKFLNMLDAPVFLVDDNVNVLAANTLAIAAFKKPVEHTRATSVGTSSNASMRFFLMDAERRRSVPIAPSGPP